MSNVKSVELRVCLSLEIQINYRGPDKSKPTISFHYRMSVSLKPGEEKRIGEQQQRTLGN